MKAFALILCFVAYAAAAVQFTGNAAVDFNDATIDPQSGKARNFGVVKVPDFVTGDGLDSPDVGVPTQMPSGTISGWDIANIYFQYDSALDQLHIGIECFGVCGDADGDGNASEASEALTNLGGQDLPNLARGESFAIALDFDLDVDQVLPDNNPGANPPFDVIIGVPAGQPADAQEVADPNLVQFLPCSVNQENNELLNTGNCFGVYTYQRSTAVNIARRFLAPVMSGGSPWPAVNHNPSPTLATPDFEWTIENLTALREMSGQSFVDDNTEEWTLYMQAFAGSFLDAGVGEDFLPSQSDFSVVQFPCLSADACGVCNGDGSSCADCLGVPNGSNVYDACDVCAGNSQECVDCMGMVNGSNQYDACDVCGGDGSSCADCAGVPAGTSVEDQCGVCDGDSSTCSDCTGVPNGTAEYDDCDVCDGDNSSCCGPHTGRECCVNYCGVPDPYWDFVLLPVTLNNLIEKFTFTRDVFQWLCDNLPEFSLIEHKAAELGLGRVAEFNRLFLEECLEPFCEQSATLYSQLVFDNAVVDEDPEYRPASRLRIPGV